MSPKEEGSATIWTVGMMMLLSVVVVGGVLVGAAARASAKAATGADLAALAGTAALLRHQGDPCAIAVEVARENHVVLHRCVVEGFDVRVWTETDVPLLSGFRLGPAEARARAGPEVQFSVVDQGAGETR